MKDIILKSFSAVSFIHCISYIFNKGDRSNLIACILFQLYFIYNSYRNIKSDERDDILYKKTMNNLYSLYGYFLYDMGYLITVKPISYLFLFHHMIGIFMIHMINKIHTKIPSIYTLKLYNLFCFIAEVTNPLLNLRYFTKDRVAYRLNMTLVKATYVIFRMFLFPLVSEEIIEDMYKKEKKESVDNDRRDYMIKGLKYSMYTVYIMSVLWFIKIIYK